MRYYTAFCCTIKVKERYIHSDIRLHGVALITGRNLPHIYLCVIEWKLPVILSIYISFNEAVTAQSV